MSVNYLDGISSNTGDATWSTFWQGCRDHLGVPCLVFEFIDGLVGISYQLTLDGRREEYFRSTELVRDRRGLDDNLTWRRHGHLFHDRFVVGCGGEWFFCTRGVWSPSVDAEFLIQIIDRCRGWFPASSVLDLGCGTGVVGIVAAKRNPLLKKLTLIDSDPSAREVAAINAKANRLSCQIHIASDTDALISHELGFVTPYYFPVDKSLVLDPNVSIQAAGRHTAELVATALSFCQRVYFVYSSVTRHAFCAAAHFQYRDLDSLLVPFSLGDNVSNSVLVSEAINQGLLIRKEHPQFPYFHIITVAEAFHGKR